jgi:thioesterase domain-containing protein
MAHQLHAAGETIGLLGMLDTRAREHMGQQTSKVSTGDSAKQGRFVRYFRRSLSHESSKAWLSFFVKDLKERKNRYATALAANMRSTMPAFLKDTFEVNTFAARNYRLKSFSGKLTLFRASKQAEEDIPFDNGWGSIFEQGIEIHDIPGDHWQVLSEPGIDVLAKTIRDCLNRLEEPLA